MSETRRRLMEDMKACMKSGDKARLGVIRMLITEVKNAEINDPKQPGRERSETEVQDLITAYHKSLTKSLADYPPDRQHALREELRLVEDFMPKQLTEDEVEHHIRTFLSGTQERSFGLLMKALQENLKGQVSGALLSGTLKRLLSSEPT